MGWSGATPVLSWKDSARVATAAALPAVTYANGTAGVGATLTANAVGVLTVDGIATVLGDRILVKNQLAGEENGVYDITVEGTAGVAAVLTRAPTSDEPDEVPNEAVFAQEGTANADAGFTQTVDAPITMGTTALVYVQFTGLGMITAGTGMTKTGNTLDVIGGTGITANANDIQIDATVATLTGSQVLTNKTYDLSSNTLTGTKAEFVTACSDGTFVYTSDTLAVFAATTSAQLAGVISDETGTGALVFAGSPVIVTPTIASFANSAHDHEDAAGGGTLALAAISGLPGTIAAILTDHNRAAHDALGTGDAVYEQESQTLTGKTLTLPTIGNFSNAAHDHTNAAGGGTIAISGISDIPGTIASILTDHNRAAHDALGTGDVVYEDETQTLTGKTLRGPNGSAGGPTYSFASAPTTGIYTDTGGNGMFYARSTGGGNPVILSMHTAASFNKPLSVAGHVTISSTAGRFIARGSIGPTQPAIQFSDDPHSGMATSGHDTVGLVINQAYRLYCHAGGVNITGDAYVSGNLTVAGDTYANEAETVLVADNHMYLNAGYVNDAAETGGLVVNYDPTTTTDTVDGGGFGFIAGEVGVSNPIIQTVGSATFSVGDFIDISGTADDPNNDGLFEVLSHVGTTLTLRGIGLTATVEDFTQNQLNTGDVLGSITKVAVSVLRAGTDGVWESASGSSTGLTFDNVVGLAATQALSNKTYDLSSNTLTGTKAEFVTACSDGTFVYTSDNLSVFAATTSAQLAGVISDETGTGALVFATGPTVTSLRIAGTTSTSFLELDDGVATAAAAAGEARLFYNDTAKTIQERHDAGGSNAMARIATGSYTGDGTTSQAITGIGFRPKFLKVWNRITVDEAAIVVFETTAEIMDDNANGGTAYHSVSGVAHRFINNAIISLDADGFTVDDDGGDGPPNTNGLVYNYMAIG